MAQQPMTPDAAKALLKEALETLLVPENKEQLTAKLEEAKTAENPQMAKMQLVMPLVTSIMTPVMQNHNQPNVMMAVMAVNMCAAQPDSPEVIKKAVAVRLCRCRRFLCLVNCRSFFF
jgi:hypothetical protein